MRSPLRLCALLCGALFFLCATAQGVQVIPFEYRDGLIWVNVQAEGCGKPLHFLLDSGAGASVLSLEAAQKMKVKLGSAARVRRVGAGATAYNVHGFHANAAGIPLGENPLALDLRETSALCCRPIDGLIGQDFFRGRIVQIDFKAGRIRLLDRSDGVQSCAVVSLKLHHDTMCVAACVNGSAPKWLRLDTGCDDGLHWVGSANGGRATASLQLGEERLVNVPTTMHRTEIFPNEAGLLGNGVLSNYVITIDAVKNRLLLAKS